MATNPLELDTYAWGIKRRLEDELDPPSARKDLSFALGQYEAKARAEGREPFSYYLQDRAEKGKLTRKLFSGPDVPGLPEEYQGPDRLAHRQRTAAIVFLSQATGLSTQETGDRLPSLMNAWAKQELGKEEISLDGFFKGVASSYELEESLRKSAVHHALMGNDWWSAYGDWAKANQGAAGWSARRAKKDDYARAFGRSGSEISNRLWEYEGLIQDTLTRMQRTMGVKWGRESKDEFDLAAAITNDVRKEDRDLFLQAVIERGRAGQVDKSGVTGLAQRIGEQLARGGRDWAKSLGNFIDYRELVAEREKYKAIAKHERDHEANPRATYVPPQDGSRIYMMSAAEAEKAVKVLDDAIELTYLAKRVREIEEGEIDPAKSDSWFGQGTLDAARSLPMTISALLPGTQLMMLGQFAEDNRHKLHAAFPTMPEERIAEISILAAPIQTLTETVSDRLLFGRLPNLAKLVKAPVTTWGSAAKRFLGVAALGFPTEMAEEVTQELTPYAMMSVVGALSQDVPDVPWRKVFAGMNREYFSRLSAAIIPLVLVGSGTSNLVELGQGRHLAERVELLEASGYAHEDALAIREAARAGDWQTAQARMRQAYASENFQADGAQLARQRAAAVQVVAAQTQPKQEATRKLEELGALPRIRIHEQGARLTFGDGRMAEFGSYEAANQARWEHLRERGFRFHASMREALSRAEKANPEFEYRVTLSPEKMTGELAVQEGLASEEAVKKAEERSQFEDNGAREEKAFTEAKAMAGMLAQDDEAQKAASVVLGRNATDFKNKVREIVLYQGGHNLPTLVHELAEVHGDQMLKSGMREFMVSSLREVERQAETEGVKLNLFRTADDAALTDVDVREAWSEFATAYAAGRQKEGRAFRKLYRAVMRTRLAAVVDAFMRVFHAVMQRAGVVAQLREEGKLDRELEAHVSRALGLEEAENEAVTVKEAEAIAAEFNGQELDADNAPFSLAAGDLDARLSRLFDPFQKDPEMRRRVGQEMKQRLARSRATWRRLVEDKRTVPSITREARQRQRQAEERIENELVAQRLNVSDIEALEAVDEAKLRNHPVVERLLTGMGRLMSRTQAMKSGKMGWEHGDYDGAPWLPPWMWGGGAMPDRAAQFLYEEGLLKDAYPDTMWNALAGAIATTGQVRERHEKAREKMKAIRREAREKARIEAEVWKKEAIKKANSAGAERARLLAALRSLNAILSALPPEVRANVGGYVQIAEVASDEARLAILEERTAKASELLEDWLRKDLTEELTKLREQAAPKGEKGKKAMGKLGAYAHRVFAKIEAYAPLDLNGVIKRVDAIGNAIAMETDPARLGEMAEEMQLLEMFGNLESKNSEELDAALRFAREVYTTGRNEWLASETARLDRLKALRGEVVTAQGVKGDDAELSDARAAETETKGKGLMFLSFVQVLERMLGKEHPLAKRWNRASREATAQKTDAIIAMERRWKEFLKAMLPDASGLEREQRIYELKTERNVTAPKMEGVRVDDMEIPVEKARQILAGTADAKAFGLDNLDVALLATEVAANDALPARRQRDHVTVRKVASSGRRSDVKLTELQAVHVTMLYGQEMYREGMEHWGWTQDTMDAVEAQLSTEAKEIREWLRANYEAGYADLNRIYARMYGVDLPKVANYAPGTFMHEGEMLTADPYGHGLMPTGGIRAGFVRQRKMHKSRPRFDQDALSLFWAHTAHTEHWKAFAEFSRELHGVLLNPEVRVSVETKHGASMMNAASRWVEAIERGGLEQRASLPVFDRIARRITNNVAYLALAYNLGTLLKQSTAALGALLRIPVSAYAKGFGKLMTGQLDAREMWQSPSIQRRIQAGYSPEIRGALAQIWEAPPSRAKKFIESGLHIIGLVDGIFTTGSAAIAYDYHFIQAKAAGLNDVQARAMAMRETEDVIARTAQPVEVVDRSLMELGLNSFARLLFMFATESRQKWALLQEAVVSRHEEGGRATLSRVLAFHFITGLLLQGIGAAWRDARNDDDDELFDPTNWNWKAMLAGVALGPLNGIPLLNDVLDTLSGYHGTQLGKAGQAVKSTGQLMEAALEGEIPGEEDAEWMMKRVVEVFNGLGIFLGDRGVSVGVGGNAAKQVFEIGDNVLDD
jgi:hypothetical protein